MDLRFDVIVKVIALSLHQAVRYVVEVFQGSGLLVQLE